MPAARVVWITLPRSVLGVLKRFAVYLPSQYSRDAGPFPVLYLFRGHETEWLGNQDDRYGLVRLLNGMMDQGHVQPMVVVMPGFMETNRETQGIPVNWSENGRSRGVGNGRMEDHFFEVKAQVEKDFAVRRDRGGVALDGFSMGGYSAVLLGTRYPRLFGSVGAYDGSFMWPGQIDPRRKPAGRACKLWFSETCSPFFRRDGVWDRLKMERHNPIAITRMARGERLLALRSVAFHVRAAGAETSGNVDRCQALDEVFAARGLRNSFRKRLRFDDDARHTWAWADRHLTETLRLHDAVFTGSLAARHLPRRSR
ncbi:MAG: hypothetical protein KDB53_07525 [Planctomycetes bacterium]|nr:hypothetical protein [Planctomycetota bacterium]